MTPRIFLLSQPEQLARFAAFLGKQDLPLNVEVREHVPKRSNNANRRLWALHTLAADVTGYSPEDMHEFSLCRFFGFSEQTIGKITRRVPIKRSSQRDKTEFAKFMESTEEWYATDFGCWLVNDD